MASFLGKLKLKGLKFSLRGTITVDDEEEEASSRLIAYYALEEDGSKIDLVGAFPLIGTDTAHLIQSNSFPSAKVGSFCGKMQNSTGHQSFRAQYDSVFNWGTNPFTIFGWFQNSSSNGTFGPCISFWDEDFASGTSGWQIMYNGSNRKMSFEIFVNGAQTNIVSHGGANINSGSWVFFTARYNGTNLFITANADHANTGSSGIASIGSPLSARLSIGARYGAGGTPAFKSNCSYDEIGICNEFLSDAEITSLYNGGTGTNYAQATAIIG